FRLMSHVGEAPRILDVGCGPGMQTIELLRLCGGTVVALDLLPEMLARVQAAAEAAGVADSLSVIEQDMAALDFPPGSFDVVWCEGAIYLLGFEAGLRKLRPLVKPGGYVAVSEAVWLKPDAPDEAVEFWREYPEIDTVEAKLAVIERVGYELVDHFVFPPSAWTEHYYDPMERRIAEKAPVWQGNIEAEAVLDAARHEIDVFRRYGDCYGYAFFVIRNA
ncbi:MAG: methyltransferase domain-containing protein, partial [Planctomycetales bacterium]|nr:methyltransferase domain-containing protein [Planctomycetales bacterium]